MKVNIKAAKERELEESIKKELEKHYTRGLKDGVLAFTGSIQKIITGVSTGNKSIEEGFNEIKSFVDKVLEKNKTER